MNFKIGYLIIFISFTFYILSNLRFGTKLGGKRYQGVVNWVVPHIFEDSCFPSLLHFTTPSGAHFMNSTSADHISRLAIVPRGIFPRHPTEEEEIRRAV